MHLFVESVTWFLYTMDLSFSALQAQLCPVNKWVIYCKVKEFQIRFNVRFTVSLTKIRQRGNLLYCKCAYSKRHHWFYFRSTVVTKTHVQLVK